MESTQLNVESICNDQEGGNAVVRTETIESNFLSDDSLDTQESAEWLPDLEEDSDSEDQPDVPEQFAYLLSLGHEAQDIIELG